MHKRLLIKNNDCPLLYISQTIIEGSFQTSLHSHPHLEVLLFENAGKIVTTNRQINVKKGSLVIINANSKHAEIGQFLKFYAVGIANFYAFSKEKINKKIIYYNLDERNYQNFLSIYHLIYNEASYEINSKLIPLFYDTLIKFVYRQENILLKHNQSNESDLISNIKGIIDNNFYQPIYLDELANTLNLSKATICHKFKQATNKSIIEYKLERQLEEAKNLLISSDMNIFDISSLVGFNNTAYFSKKFKEKYFVSPTSLRKQKSLLKEDHK